MGLKGQKISFVIGNTGEPFCRQFSATVLVTLLQEISIFVGFISSPLCGLKRLGVSWVKCNAISSVAPVRTQ